MHRISTRGERELFDRLRAAPSRADRDAAVRRYLPLAHGLAARYRHSCESLEDLEQVAAIGLLKAIDRFDPDRGKAFASFAVPTILGELRRHFRDRTWALRVPRTSQELLVKLEQARDELTAALGHQPTIAELASHLGLEEELVLQLLELSLARHTFPLTPPGSDDADAGELPGELDAGYGRAEDRDTVTRLLSTLSAREVQIVLLRFNADLSQDVIAHHLGVSQMYVSRSLRRSLTQLRDAAG